MSRRAFWRAVPAREISAELEALPDGAELTAIITALNQWQRQRPPGRGRCLVGLRRWLLDEALKSDVPLDGEVAAIEIDLGDERITLLGIHPVSPTTSARAAARDRLILGAADWVAQRPGEVVVVGDLNATPWSQVYSTLRLRGGLIDTLRGRGLQPSWPEGWGPLMIPIDHALHTRGLGSANRHTGPAFGSEHRPVIVEIGRR